MKAKFECIECFIQQITRTAMLHKIPENDFHILIREIEGLLNNSVFNLTPPEIASFVYQTFSNVTGINDPYKKIKADSNQIMMNEIDHFRNVIHTSDEPIISALKLAVPIQLIMVQIRIFA